MNKLFVYKLLNAFYNFPGSSKYTVSILYSNYDL